jgi:phosphate transport system permease protein
LFRFPRRNGTSWSELVVEALIRAGGLSAVLFVVLIFLFLFRESLPAFGLVPLGDLAATRWYPIEGYFGIVPLVLGTLLVTLGAALLAVPTGMGAALFIAEVAPRWTRDVLKPVIEVLAGIPSVVLGFMGILVLAPLLRTTLGLPTGLNAFTGALLLAGMALPTIISVAEDALDAVPRSYRDAALALGATRWQTIWRVTLPAARSGVLVAIMLGIGRALGETMTVLMVTGNAARLPLELDALLRPVRTMTATIAAEMGEVAQGSNHYYVLFVVGLLLFVISFLINLAAASVVFRARRHQERVLS